MRKNVSLNTILLVVALLFFPLLWAHADIGLNFNVPVPPESEIIETRNPVFGEDTAVPTVVYRSREDKDKIVKYYQDFFKKEGFSNILDKQYSTVDKELLRFRKDDLVVSVAVYIRSEETHVTIAKYLQPEGSPSPEDMKPSVEKGDFIKLPQKDAPGADLSFVPRPPESVRWLSNEKLGTLMYLSRFTVKEVRNFYKEKLSSYGWALERDISTAESLAKYQAMAGKDYPAIGSPFSDGEDFNSVIKESYFLNFKSQRGDLRIVIFPNFVDRQIGSMVQINYKEADK
jgi:hypothetical protein